MEVHIKTTMRFHLNAFRIVKYITTMKTNAGKDMEQGDSLLLQVHSCTAIVESNIQSSKN